MTGQPSDRSEDRTQHYCEEGHSLNHPALEVEHKGLGCSRAASLDNLMSNIRATIRQSRDLAGIQCEQYPCRGGGNCRIKLTKDDGTGDDFDLATIDVTYVTVQVDGCDGPGWECKIDGTLSVRSECYCQ